MANIQKLTYPYFTDGTTQLNAANLNPIIAKINEAIDKLNEGVTPTQTVATPTISISGTTATITCSTSGATIYYTLNGDTPTTGSTPYSSPITLSGACTIKAIAVKSGMNNSSVANTEYNPSATVQPPTIYIRDLAIIMDGESGSTIHYTLDGSTPTASSPTYSGALTNGNNCTVKAIAIKNGASSSVSTASFTAPQTTELRAPMIVVEGNKATILSNGVGASIKYATTYNTSNYSTDGITWTTYTEPITLTEDTMLISKVNNTGGVESAYAILNYKTTDGSNCILCSKLNDKRFEYARTVKNGSSESNLQLNTAVSKAYVSFYAIQQGARYRFSLRNTLSSCAYWAYAATMPNEITGELNINGKYPTGQDVPAADSGLVPFDITAENYAYIATCWQGTTLTPFTEIIK